MIVRFEDYVVWECPHCGAKSVDWAIASCNTIGAKIWSDGFMIARMAMPQDIVTRCWTCGKAFCSQLAKHTIIARDQVAEGDRHYVDWTGDYTAIQEVLTSEKDLTPELERELRIRILWAGNHKVRETPSYSDERSVVEMQIFAAPQDIPEDEVRENMVKLSEAPDVSPCLRAEVLREMGKFGKAKKVLDEFAKSDTEEFKNVQKTCEELLAHIKMRDSTVFLRPKF